MPAYVNIGTRSQSGGATSLTPALPASRTTGNLLLAIVGSKNNYTHTCPTSGWTKYDQRNSGTGWTVSLWVYRRTSGGVDGAETSPVVTVGSSNVACFAQVIQYSGPFDTNDILVGASSFNTGTVSTHSCTGITTTRNNSLVIYLDAAAANTALGTPSTWTENFDNGSTTGASSNAGGSKTVSTAGTGSGDISVTGANAAWVMWQIELCGPSYYAWEKGRFETDASQDTYSTPSWTPSANTGRWLAVWWYGTIDTLPTVSGNGLTWSEVSSIQANDYGVSLFKGSGSPSAGAVTVTFGGSNPSRCAGVIIETPNDYTIAQTKTNSTAGDGSLTVTFDVAPSSSSWIFGIFNAKWPETVGAGYSALATAAVGTNWDQIRTLWAYREDGDQTVDCTFDYSAAVGIAVELSTSQSYTLTAETGSHSVSGTPTGLFASRKLSAATGTLNVAGQAAILVRGYILLSDAVSFASAGQAATLLASRRLSAGAGSLTLTGWDAFIGRTLSMIAETAAFLLEGNDATLSRQRVLFSQAGSFVVAGVDVALRREARILINLGTLALSFGEASLTVSRLMSTSAAPFSINGQDAALLRAARLAAVAGSFASNGQATGLIAQRLLSTTTGGFTLTGYDAILQIGGSGFILVANAGTFLLGGQDVSLRAGRILTAVTGGYMWGGVEVSLRAERFLQTFGGAITVMGTDADTRASRLLQGQAGAFVLDGQESLLLVERLVAAGWAAFVLTGNDVLLVPPSTVSLVMLQNEQLLKSGLKGWKVRRSGVSAEVQAAELRNDVREGAIENMSVNKARLTGWKGYS